MEAVDDLEENVEASHSIIIALNKTVVTLAQDLASLNFEIRLNTLASRLVHAKQLPIRDL